MGDYLNTAPPQQPSIGFLDNLAQQIGAARLAQSVAGTVSPLIGGTAAPVAPPPQMGILGRLLGFGGDQQQPGAPIQLAGATPPAAPGGGTLDRLISGSSQPPAPTIVSQVTPPGQPNLMAGAPVANASPSLALGTPDGNGGLVSPQPRQPAYSPAPSSLPTFAAGAGVPTGVSPNAQQALAFYQSKGLSPLAASALVGGFTAESGPGLNPAAVNRGDGSDGSNSGGIGQWNGPRGRALQQFAAANRLDPNDINTQLQFSWAELNGPEKATLNALQQVQNPMQATAAALGYERPAGWTAENPFGAKTFKQRLQATAALAGAGAGGSPAPLRGAASSPYGALDPSAFGTAGGPQVPTFAASGQGGTLSPATQFAAVPAIPPGGSMGAFSTGQPVPIQANGAALGYTPPGPTAAQASASQAIAGAIKVPGYDGTFTRDQANDADGVPSQAEWDAAAKTQGGPAAAVTTQAPLTAPGTANALSPAAPLQQASNPGGAPLNGQVIPPGSAAGNGRSIPNGFAPVTPDMVRALVQNPDTQQMGIQLWQNMLTNRVPPIVAHDGDVILDGITGRPIYTAPHKLDIRTDPNSNLIGIDPYGGATKTIVGAEPAFKTVAPADYAKYHIPADFAGVAQLDADNKLHVTSASDLAGSGPLASAQQRQQLMQQQGRDMSDPQVQNFIATGQGLAKPTMTGPEERIYNQDSDAVDNLKVAIDQLRQAKAMNSSINTGWGGNLAKAANSATLGGLYPQSVANTDTYNNIIATAQAAAAKSAVGGRVTQWDEKFFQGIAPNSSNGPASRAQIIDNQIAVQTQRLQAAQQRLDQMKSGSFFMKNTSPQGGAPASPTPSATQAPTPPQPGTVYKGYVFRGGDPSQASSWQPVQ